MSVEYAAYMSVEYKASLIMCMAVSLVFGDNSEICQRTCAAACYRRVLKETGKRNPRKLNSRHCRRATRNVSRVSVRSKISKVYDISCLWLVATLLLTKRTSRYSYVTTRFVLRRKVGSISHERMMGLEPLLEIHMSLLRCR